MPRVVVIGGANADIKGRSSQAFIAGTSNPGTVMTTPGGVGRNIAHNLGLLGLEVMLVAAIGSDGNGDMIARETAKAGVDCSRLKRSDVPTGTYLAIVDGDGELVAAVNDMRAADALFTDDLARLAAEFARADVLVADCNIPLACLAWLEEFARETQRRLIVEPVSVPKAAKLLALPSRAGVHAITPNRQQLAALGGTASGPAAIAALRGRGLPRLVVHCGAQGALVVEEGRETVVPAQAQQRVADVTGAGDAAVAGLVFGLTRGLTLIESARLGQTAAALKLQSQLSVASSLSRDTLLASPAPGQP